MKLQPGDRVKLLAVNIDGEDIPEETGKVIAVDRGPGHNCTVQVDTPIDDDDDCLRDVMVDECIKL